MARTSEYNYEMCVEICDEISCGKNVMAVLNSNDNYPSWPTFRRWKRDNEKLRTLYVNAIKDKSEAVLFEIDEISQDLKDESIDASRANVLIQTLKWKAAKFYPKMFGEKVDHTSSDGSMTPHTNIITTMSQDELKKALDK